MTSTGSLLRFTASSATVGYATRRCTRHTCSRSRAYAARRRPSDSRPSSCFDEPFAVFRIAERLALLLDGQAAHLGPLGKIVELQPPLERQHVRDAPRMRLAEHAATGFCGLSISARLSACPCCPTGTPNMTVTPLFTARSRSRSFTALRTFGSFERVSRSRAYSKMPRPVLPIDADELAHLSHDA